MDQEEDFNRALLEVAVMLWLCLVSVMVTVCLIVAFEGGMF